MGREGIQAATGSYNVWAASQGVWCCLVVYAYVYVGIICAFSLAHVDASTSPEGMSAPSSAGSSLIDGGTFSESGFDTSSGGSIALGGCELLPPPLRPPEPPCGPERGGFAHLSFPCAMRRFV